MENDVFGSIAPPLHTGASSTTSPSTSKTLPSFSPHSAPVPPAPSVSADASGTQYTPRSRGSVSGASGDAHRVVHYSPYAPSITGTASSASTIRPEWAAEAGASGPGRGFSYAGFHSQVEHAQYGFNYAQYPAGAEFLPHPPSVPPRHSSLFGHPPPPMPREPHPASPSAGLVPSVQVTHPTPTKRKSRARPISTTSVETTVPNRVKEKGRAAQGDMDDGDALDDGAGPSGVHDADAAIAAASAAADQAKKDRTREKGRERQRRKRERDKLARDAEGIPHGTPSFPSSASTTYSSLPQSHSVASLSLSPNASFAFSSTTSLSGQSSPSAAFSPIIDTSALFSPTLPPPLGSSSYATDQIWMGSPVGTAASSLGRSRSRQKKTYIPRPSLTSRQSQPGPGPSASLAPKPEPPSKRRKSEPEPEEFRQTLGSAAAFGLGFGPGMGGAPPGVGLGVSIGEDGRPAWASTGGAFSRPLSSNASEVFSTDTSVTGDSQRSPTPPPVADFRHVPVVLHHKPAPLGHAPQVAPSAPALSAELDAISGGQMFASLLLRACEVGEVSAGLAKLGLDRSGLEAMRSELEGVYQRWRGMGRAMRIDTDVPSNASLSSAPSLPSYPSSTSVSATDSPLVSPTASRMPLAYSTPSRSWQSTVPQPPQPDDTPVARSRFRTAPQARMSTTATARGLVIDPHAASPVRPVGGAGGPGAMGMGSPVMPKGSDSPVNTAIQTPSTGQGFAFQIAPLAEAGPAGAGARARPAAHARSQTDPDGLRGRAEGRWFGGQLSGPAEGVEGTEDVSGQGRGLESPIAAMKARQGVHGSQGSTPAYAYGHEHMQAPRARAESVGGRPFVPGSGAGSAHYNPGAYGSDYAPPNFGTSAPVAGSAMNMAAMPSTPVGTSHHPTRAPATMPQPYTPQARPTRGHAHAHSYSFSHVPTFGHEQAQAFMGPPYTPTPAPHPHAQHAHHTPAHPGKTPDALMSGSPFVGYTDGVPGGMDVGPGAGADMGMGVGVGMVGWFPTPMPVSLPQGQMVYGTMQNHGHGDVGGGGAGAGAGGDGGGGMAVDASSGMTTSTSVEASPSHHPGQLAMTPVMTVSGGMADTQQYLPLTASSGGASHSFGGSAAQLQQ